MIRRQKVIESLLFLKDHNPLYKDVVIDIRNLSWMRGSDEACLENIIDIHDSDNEDISPMSSSCNVSHIQCNDRSTKGVGSSNSMDYCGAVIKKTKSIMI